MEQTDEQDAPEEIDFSRGTRGLHHIPKGSRIIVPQPTETARCEDAIRSTQEE